MAKTVPEGFLDFHSKLTPSSTESAAAKSHRGSIEACLTSELGMLRFFRSGSFGYGTSIRNYSDVDYFASLPADRISQNSSTTLELVKGVLDRRFPNTGVLIRGPAVVVPFGTDRSETTEIVPASLV